MRSHIRLGSRLALFALAVQIVLAFGHVHPFGVVPAAAKSAVSGLAVGSGQSVVRPPADQPNRSADSDCPICALIQMAASSAPSAPPALPLPQDFGLVGPQPTADVVLAALPQFLFRARAPPAI
ncbi:MAG TPA: hypothetical protein VGH49_01105 [Xanthobacteraceae bacterium]